MNALLYLHLHLLFVSVVSDLRRRKVIPEHWKVVGKPFVLWVGGGGCCAPKTITGKKCGECNKHLSV